MNQDLRKYVKSNLVRELDEIKKSNRFNNINELDEFEKAIIYHYTDSGYEVLNQTLREGGNLTEFGKYLNYSLNKLPNYRLLCYRAIKCSETKLKKYHKAFNSDTVIVEKSFLSCSKSKMLSQYFSDSPLFIILSKRGKEIEKIAKFGIDSSENEREILFMSNSKFKVIDFRKEDNKITITLEEI